MKFRMAAAIIILIGITVGAGAEQTIAQDRGEALPEPAEIPSPSEFHGYEMGSQYTITSAIYDYYQTLAEASPRVEYQEYGESVQGRALPMLFIGNEETLARKEQIRSNMQRLTGVTESLSEAELEQLSAETPAIAWLYIVDTDEEAGVEALQEVAYELATSEDATMSSIRENVLVVLTPLTNPDSHARYVTWHKLYHTEAAASVDQNAVENDAHWGMNTDGNAWGVDVNRDFGFFVTPEMQALGRTVMDWRPPLFLDIHSGPNVIFIPPFPRPFHPLWPEMAPKWWEYVAEEASTDFGQKGWSFSSRKDYEGVAGIGFGLSWGMLGPATSGLLYETFGGRPGKTLAFRRSDGTIATMRMAMDRHKQGIYSMLEVARDRRQELLRDTHERVINAVRGARENSVRTVVVPAAGEGVDPDKVSRLVDRLTLQDVDVRRTEESFSAEVQGFYSLDESTQRNFSAGTYVIDLVQPQARLARALLDPTIDFSNPKVEVPYDRKMPYYDAPWGNLPYLFGVDAYASGENLDNVAIQQVNDGLEQSKSVATLNREAPPYAYVLPAGLEASYRTAIQLMEDGYRLRVFTDPFQLDGTKYRKGTWAAIRGRNPEGLGERIQELARKHGTQVKEVAGPYSDAGLTFGDDERLAAVPDPLVAVVADEPVAQDHVYGGIRSSMSVDFGLAFSPVELETVNTADLSKYTTVVLPHAGMSVRGGPNFSQGYKDRLNLENLRQYVQGGGTLVAVRGAAEVVAQDSVLGQDVHFDGWVKKTEAVARAAWNAASTPRSSAVVEWRPGLREVGLPMLGAGYEREDFAAPASFPVLLATEDEGEAEVVSHYGKDPEQILLDGFMRDVDRPVLAGRPFVIVQPVGQGRVIYFAEDPTFRGQWYGMNILFLNSLLFGPIL